MINQDAQQKRQGKAERKKAACVMSQFLPEWVSDPNLVIAAASLGTSYIQGRKAINQDAQHHDDEVRQANVLQAHSLKEQLELHRAAIEQAHAHHLSAWNQNLWLHRRDTMRSNHIDRVNAVVELLHEEREAERDQCESYSSNLQTQIVSATVLLGGVFVVMIEGDFGDAAADVSDAVEILFATLCVASFTSIFLSVIIAIRQTQELNDFMRKKAQLHKEKTNRLLQGVFQAENESKLPSEEYPLGDSFIENIALSKIHAGYHIDPETSRRWNRRGIEATTSVYKWWKSKQNRSAIRISYALFGFGSVTLSSAVATFVDTRFRHLYKNERAAWIFDGTCIGAFVLLIVVLKIGSKPNVKTDPRHASPSTPEKQTRKPNGNTGSPWPLPSPAKESTKANESIDDEGGDDLNFVRMEEGILQSYFDPPGSKSAMHGIVKVSDLIPRTDFVSLDGQICCGERDTKEENAVNGALRPVYHHLRHRFRRNVGSRWFAQRKEVDEIMNEVEKNIVQNNIKSRQKAT